MLGLATRLSTGGASLLTYVKDNLKLYLNFTSNKSDTLKFPCEGSTSFDGGDDIINCGSDSSLDNIWSGGGTLTAWINPSSDGEGDDGRIVEKRDDGDGWTFVVREESSGSCKLKLFVNYSTTNGQYVSGADVTIGAWNHIALVYDTSGAGASYRPTIYVNGVVSALSSTTDSVGTADTDVSEDVTIGGNKTPLDRCFDGKIANVALWSRALSLEEINSVMRKNYSQLKTVEKTSLVSWWALDDVDATGHMETPELGYTRITTGFPTNIYLNSHGTTEYTEAMANDGNLTTEGAWAKESGAGDVVFADTGVYPEGALKVDGTAIVKVATNSINASVIETLVANQLYKFELTYTRVHGVHAGSWYMGENNSFGGADTDVKFKEGFWNTDDGSADEKTITGYFFHVSGKNYLWFRNVGNIEVHIKTISLLQHSLKEQQLPHQYMVAMLQFFQEQSMSQEKVKQRLLGMGVLCLMVRLNILIWEIYP